MNKFKSVFDVDGLLLKVCPVQLEICDFVNNFRTQTFDSRTACTPVKLWKWNIIIALYREKRRRFLTFFLW